jgi:hypothetical protein
MEYRHVAKRASGGRNPELPDVWTSARDPHSQRDTGSRSMTSNLPENARLSFVVPAHDEEDCPPTAR